VQKDEITAELLHLEPIDQSATAAAAGPTAEPAKAAQPVRWDDASVTLSEVEKQHILQVLEKNNHNKSKTAKVLGISRSTLREKLKEYGIS